MPFVLSNQLSGGKLFYHEWHFPLWACILITASARYRSTKASAAILPGKPSPTGGGSTSASRIDVRHVPQPQKMTFREFRAERYSARAECGIPMSRSIPGCLIRPRGIFRHRAILRAWTVPQSDRPEPMPPAAALVCISQPTGLAETHRSAPPLEHRSEPGGHTLDPATAVQLRDVDLSHPQAAESRLIALGHPPPERCQHSPRTPAAALPPPIPQLRPFSAAFVRPP
jgi:hypothetical protein